MKSLFHLFDSKITFILFLVGVLSCQQKGEVPYPENPSNYEIPEALPFSLPEGKPLIWKNLPADSVPVGKTMKFDLDRLPSVPFDLQEEVPLQSPLKVTSFDWDQLEEIPFELELEADSVTGVITPLPEPIIFSTSTLLKADNTNAGVLALTSGQGLPGTTVFAQEIGANGTHWIGTEQGLVKYTGNEFHLYDIITSDFTGVLNTISDLEFLSDGRLLVSTFRKGFLIVDAVNQTLESFELPYGFSRGYVDSEGNYWGGTVTPTIKFVDFQQGRIFSLKLPEEQLTVNNSLGAFQDSKKNFWIAFNNAVGVVNPDKTSMKILRSDPLLQSFANYDFTESSEGDIYISSFSPGLSIVSLENETISRLGLEQGFGAGALDIQLDEQENVWIGSNGSFTIYKPKSNSLKTIETNLNMTGQGPPAESIIDGEGMYWQGTWPNGLILYDPSGTDSRHFNVDDGLLSNDTWGIAEDGQSNVWLATYGGLHIYHPEAKEIKYLEIPASIGKNDHRGVSKIDENTLFIGSVGGFALVDLENETLTAYTEMSGTDFIAWRAIQRPDGTIWIVNNQGLLTFNPEKRIMKKLDQSSGLAGNTIWGVLGDHENQVWLVGNSGIDIVDPENNMVRYLGVNEGLPTVDQSALLITDRNEMVIGGGKGISIINKDRTTITKINRAHGLSPEGLYDMVFSQGRIQLGTENGIVVIDRPESDSSQVAWRFTNFAKPEGYPFSDYNQSTGYVMSDGKVWWAASPILSVNLQDPMTQESSKPRLALTGVKIMDQLPSFARTFEKSGEQERIAMGEDFDYLAKNNIRWDSVHPQTKMPIGLILPHHQNSLTFLFTNPTIKSRDEIEFRYVLEGSNNEWSEITKTSTSKTYFNLLPGEYTFKVITKGFNGVWSDPATFSFTISPPWWLTWWAFLLYFFALGLLVYATVQVRSSYLKRENKLLEDRVNHRTAQLKQSIDELKATQEQLIQSEKMASLGELTAGIAHEIQNPLNFVNNFSEVSNELIQEIKEEQQKENKDDELINEIIDDISQNLAKINFHGKRADSIVKGMLQHSRNNSGQKELSDINVIADEYLRLSYHGLRAKDKSFTADFKLELDPDLPKIEILPQDLGRVLLNLINNGFYAAGEKKKALIEAGSPEANAFLPTVTVSTKKLEGAIEIRVRDNGNGIPEDIKSKIFQPFFTTKPTGKGTGLGLSMSYDIITKGHEGTLEVESKKEEYTEFIIILPY